MHDHSKAISYLGFSMACDHSKNNAGLAVVGWGEHVTYL